MLSQASEVFVLPPEYGNAAADGAKSDERHHAPFKIRGFGQPPDLLSELNGDDSEMVKRSNRVAKITLKSLQRGYRKAEEAAMTGVKGNGGGAIAATKNANPAPSGISS